MWTRYLKWGHVRTRSRPWPEPWGRGQGRGQISDAEAELGCLQIWQNEIPPRFPGLSDPLNSLFHIIIKGKPDVTNHLSCQFGNFLAELQNILLKEHGDWLHPCQSLCHSTNLRYCYWQLCTQLNAQEILSYNNQQHLINSLSKFYIPEFSLSFPELTNSLRFPCCFPEL